MQNIPLAERIRPRKLSEVIGQRHLQRVSFAIAVIAHALTNNPPDLGML